MSRVIPEQHFNTLVSVGEQPRQQQVAAQPSVDTQRISYYQWVPLIPMLLPQILMLLPVGAADPHAITTDPRATTSGYH